MISRLRLYLYDYDLPLPDRARERIEQIVGEIAPRGTPLRIESSKKHWMPNENEEWDVSVDRIPLTHPNLQDWEGKTGVAITYMPPYEGHRGYFQILAYLRLGVEIDDETRDFVNHQASFLVEMAEQWIEVRPPDLAVFKPDTLEAAEKAYDGHDLPRRIHWWNWFGPEMVENEGRERLLEADLYRVEEIGEGIVWQLSDQITNKPHPSLLKELEAIYGDRDFRVAIGI